MYDFVATTRATSHMLGHVMSKEETLYYETFHHINPLNCIIGTIVILLNTCLLFYFAKNTTKLTGRLFLYIAIADIAAALGHILPATGDMLYFNDKINIKTFWYFGLSYRVFGLLSFCCSILLNVVLSVLRTMRILKPFYQPNLLVLRVVMVTYIMVLVSLSVVDMYYFLSTTQFHDLEKFWKTKALALDRFPFPGDRIVAIIDPHIKDKIKFTFLLLYYIFPVTIVLISMLVLLLGVWYKTRYHDNQNTPRVVDWSHVTTTVLILSLLFSLCDGAMATTWCFLYTIPTPNLQLIMMERSYLCTIIGVAISTLPLLYSLAFPLVVVFRSHVMRERVRALFTRYRALIVNSDNFVSLYSYEANKRQHEH